MIHCKEKMCYSLDTGSLDLENMETRIVTRHDTLTAMTRYTCSGRPVWIFLMADADILKIQSRYIISHYLFKDSKQHA